MDKMRPKMTEGKEKQTYNEKQIEFIRKLVQVEHCGRDMIYNLTGIPVGTVISLSKRLGVQISREPSGGGGNYNLHAIRRARKLAILRDKYAAELAALFPPKSEGPENTGE